MRLSERLIYADIRLGQVLGDVHDEVFRAEYLPIEQRLVRRNIEPTDELVHDKKLQQQAFAILGEGSLALMCSGKAFENFPQVNPGYAVAFGLLTLDGISRFVRGHGLIGTLKEFFDWYLEHATYVDREHPNLRYKFPNFPGQF